MKTFANQPQPSESDDTTRRGKSRGGLYLAAGSLILILGGFVASMPGGFWQIFLISFAFNLVGLILARGLLRRSLAVVLTGLSGGLFVQIAKKEFETVSELKEIKSASQHADGSIWVSDPKDIGGAMDWQSDAIIPVIPEGAAIRYTINGARFYKARWWQQVNFSY